MTTISNNSFPSADAIVPRRPTSVAVTGKSESYLGKALVQTPEQKAEIVKARADMAAASTASEKQLQDVKKRLSAEGMESHQMYLPNIASLSLEDAKMMVDVTQEMMESDRYKGIIVNGHNGDQQISDFGTYKAALVDYINNYQTDTSKPAGGGATVSSQARTTAAATYRQMQALTDKGGSEG